MVSRMNDFPGMPTEKLPLRDEPKERRCTVCEQNFTKQHHVDWEPYRFEGECWLREVWERSECGSKYFDGRDRR